MWTIGSKWNITSPGIVILAAKVSNPTNGIDMAEWVWTEVWTGVDRGVDPTYGIDMAECVVAVIPEDRREEQHELVKEAIAEATDGLLLWNRERRLEPSESG